MRHLSKTSSPDFAFLSLLIILVIFGLVMLTSASSDLAKTRLGDSLYYLKHQLITGLLVGIVGFLVGFFLFYRRWANLAIILLILNIIFLILVFTPFGIEAKGANRWLGYGSFSFQPGELLKLSFLIFLAFWISKSQTRGKSASQGLLPFLFLIGIVVGLLLLQPATTTAVLIAASAAIMYFIGGAKIKFLIALVLLGILIFTIVVSLTPYRMERIKSFLDRETNKLDEGYQINQTLIAIGSGGLTGTGFGKSNIKMHLPEPLGDSIFAVIAEELGFIGSALLIIIFLLFIWRGFKIAKASPDNFSRLLAIGFSSLIGLQTFINIGAMTGIIPLTGVPLPFISYGGTALVVFLTMSGIMLNISKYRK